MDQQAMRSFGGWLLQRLAEPSTWRGLGVIAVASGMASAETVEHATTAGLALIGCVEVFRKEF